MDSMQANATTNEELLRKNEKLWEEQRKSYEDQIHALKKRIEDLSSQNKLLFDQVDLLSKSENSYNQQSSATPNEDLVLSLRSDRDILQTRLSVTEEEGKALRLKLSSVNTELTNTRAKLTEIRQQYENTKISVEEHDNIMNQLNQLNLLRESNITLRNEANDSREKAKQLQEDLETLREKVLPLEAEQNRLKEVIKENEQQLNAYKEECNRWKQRSQDILTKHKKIDPVEHEKLEAEIATLKQNLADKKKENEELNDRFNRIKKQAHERLNSSKATQQTLIDQIKQLEDENAHIQSLLETERGNIQNTEEKFRQMNKQSEDVTALRSQLEEASFTKFEGI